MTPDSKDPLDTLLDRGDDSPIPTDITRNVWQRISLHETTETEPGFLHMFSSWLNHWPTAALFIACCALTGILLAEVRAGQLERDRNSQLARSYLELIDPLLKEMSTIQKS